VVPTKDAEIDALPRILRAVHAGEGAISRELTRGLMRQFRSRPDNSSGLRPIKGPVTAREWEVVDLLKSGQSSEHVADLLVLSHETVRSHTKNIMRKLEVHTRADALAAAETLRLAPLNADHP
jgi:two-component system, NarL family, response regulator LiaR